jgi:hypothetical protein
MGNFRVWRALIRESICYHEGTDLGALKARADRFFEAARAIYVGTRPERLSEVFLARERVA